MRKLVPLLFVSAIALVASPAHADSLSLTKATEVSEQLLFSKFYSSAVDGSGSATITSSNRQITSATITGVPDLSTQTVTASSLPSDPLINRFYVPGGTFLSNSDGFTIELMGKVSGLHYADYGVWTKTPYDSTLSNAGGFFSGGSNIVVGNQLPRSGQVTYNGSYIATVDPCCGGVSTTGPIQLKANFQTNAMSASFNLQGNAFSPTGTISRNGSNLTSYALSSSTVSSGSVNLVGNFFGPKITETAGRFSGNVSCGCSPHTFFSGSFGAHR